MEAIPRLGAGSSCRLGWMRTAAWAGVQVGIAMGMASLVWVFAPHLPAGPTLITLVAPIALPLAPSFRSAAYRPVLLAIGVGIALPDHGLAASLWICGPFAPLFSLGLCIIFLTAGKPPLRTLGLIVVLSILSVTNVQMYNFVPP